MMHFKNSYIVPCVIFILGLCIYPSLSHAQNTTGKKNIFAERPLIHVLGPSPALSPNDDDSAVDSKMMESSDVFKDLDTYYWYYHARSKDQERWPNSYRLCVATAPSPLGPWKRYAEGNPILDTGKEDEWDHGLTACACILKEDSYETVPGTETYYMWYFAFGGKDFPGFGAIGLATADNPLGPWKKYEGNPVMEWPKGGVYPGSVSKIDEKFYMFAQHPVSTADQGAFCIAYADKPEGPWELYEGNPVLSPGDWGSWDDGGYSEACARYHEGVYHCVYGGTKAPKIESLGYAWSFDLINWHKYGANPVIPLSRIPDGSGFAEVHCYVEGAYIYVFHTLRYYTGEATARGLGSVPEWDTEDLAIQVLTIDPKFKVAFPTLYDFSLRAGQSSRLAECLPIGLEAASTLAVTVECTYDKATKAGVRLHLRASEDGVHCDTDDLYTFDLPFRAGKTVKKTFEMSPNVKFAKVIVENIGSRKVTSINVTATVGN